MRGVIPPHVFSSGTMFNGRIKTRNAIEAAILGGGIFYLLKPLLSFLPLTVSLIIRLSIGAVLLVAAGVGIHGQPLSVAVTDFMNFRRTRTCVTMKMKMPEIKSKKKFGLKKK